MKILQIDKDLTVSVGVSYSEDLLLHTFLDNLNQGGNIKLR